MTITDLRDYCLKKPYATEDTPFSPDTLTFKVKGKMFVLTNLTSWEQGEPSINLKCDPKTAVDLRDQFPETVLPGYHMNKKHWNTLRLNRDLPDPRIYHWINHSYDRVVAGLPKKQRNLINESRERT